MDEREILAAGAVVSRKGPQVLLIHRPKYDDWSFPKGKLDPGEHAVAAAVREVAEETGVDIRLGPPLPDQTYTVGNGTLRPKRVRYWVGRPMGDDDVSTYRPNAEVDDVAWVDLDKARRKLSHDHDRVILDAFTAVRRRSTPLLVVRHGKAEPRKTWRGDDRERPLSPAGELQSDELVPLLAAYGVRRIVSSSSRRCWTTLAPYAHTADVDLGVTDALTEEDADDGTVTEVLHGLLTSKTPTALCTHRPVVPLVLRAIGVTNISLDPGAMVVVHHRRGQVVAVEQHAV
ncbi:MAG TPA: NUDIX hydrolase [Nocardioides sp.]|uniref:NUDIX hydrolase n=1 Tax=Nocardioides sp. TaxID=35761 RepID=UPI002D7EF9E8|nr:NUDIX hydrolase [Nocardioides sp.]HET6653152.1 NUDIX hydrolase [Nocardioides sp.]